MMVWLVRVPESPQDNLSWLFAGTGPGLPEAAPANGSLDEFAGALRAANLRAPVAVLLPASCALASTVTSAIRQARQLQQALPFLVEENLAIDIDAMHIAPGARTGSAVRFVAVSRALISRVLADFAAAGIDPDILTVDGLLLPLPAATDAAVVHLDGNRSVVASAAGVLLSLAEADVPAALTLAANPPTQIDVYLGSEAALVTARTIEAECAGPATPTIHEPQIAWLSLLASPGLPARLKSAPNLRSGEFARKGGSVLPEMGFDWRPLAALAAVCAIVVLGYQLSVGIASDRAASAVRNEAVALYRQYFPGAAQVLDPRRQMQAQVSQAAGSATGFIPLAADASEVITEMNNAGGQFLTRGLGWEQGTGQLRLDLVARSLEDVEQLRQKLEARGIHVEMGAGLSQDGGYRARLNLGAGT